MAIIPRGLERRFLTAARRERLAGPIYAAMVDNLFGTLVGFAALGFASVLLAALTFAAKPGLATGAMLAAIVGIVTLRSLLMIEYHRWKRRPPHADSRCCRLGDRLRGDRCLPHADDRHDLRLQPAERQRRVGTYRFNSCRDGHCGLYRGAKRQPTPDRLGSTLHLPWA